jgi:hypothetical protein
MWRWAQAARGRDTPGDASLPRATAVNRDSRWAAQAAAWPGDGLTRLHDAKSFNRRRPCRARRQDVKKS